MNSSSPQNNPHLLQQLMQRVGFSSFRALGQAAGVSEKQIRRLRRGEVAQIRLETLLKLSQVLQVSIAELLEIFIPSKDQSREGKPQNSQLTYELENLRQEYNRLQQQLLQQKQALQQEFQQSSLQVLESLLLQLPTAAYTAQQNPQVPAVKLLPLLKPLERLLQEWGIEAIAEVGSEVVYDPQQHQLMEGFAEAGDLVRVRYTGYRQGDKLLYRAKVSPLSHH
ncbi:nucleotide exchange factor GrpE [Leptothermofonsia sp. ETS-13]|uniref:nucleotide exchange factor GrpE n=1 Tax=Leptothermofonsia sp. ETS-13 TaxID=3035696 RepID=UPI003B9DF996